VNLSGKGPCTVNGCTQKYLLEVLWCLLHISCSWSGEVGVKSAASSSWRGCWPHYTGDGINIFLHVHTVLLWPNCGTGKCYVSPVWGLGTPRSSWANFSFSATPLPPQSPYRTYIRVREDTAEPDQNCVCLPLLSRRKRHSRK
jgi:hypothetical protein